MKQSEERFVQQIKETLDKGVRSLDQSVEVRLRAARFKALDAVAVKGGVLSFFGRGLLPIAGVITAAMVVLVLFWNEPSEIQSTATEYVLDSEILESQDSIELLLDMDFYVWLAEGQGNGAG